MKTEKQLTAVEWLEKISNGGLVTKSHFNELLQQAKEMEKEQSIELIRQTAMYMAASDFDEDIAKMTFEDIYETLKQEEQ
jgi:hypothetical protein